MSKRMKSFLIGGIGFYALIVVAALLFAASSREDFHSPATATRDTYGFREGRFGLLEKTDQDTEAVWPAADEMTAPVRIEGAKGSFALDWSQEVKLATTTAAPPTRWAGALEGDDRVDLVAFASWIPRADDPYESGNWTVELVFRDPITTEALSPEELAALGVPASFSQLSPPKKYQTPVLRLLFRTSGMEYVHSPALVAGDARTGAQVSYDLQDSNDGSPRREAEGAWLRLDTDLLVWHDTPLTCHVQFLTGEAQIAELPQTSGAQVAFGDRLRLQWLARVERPVAVRSRLNEFEPSTALPLEEQDAIRKRFRDHEIDRSGIFSITPDTDEAPAPLVIARTSSPRYLADHCGRISAEGVIWEWDEKDKEEGVAIVSLPASDSASDPLRLVFLPHVAELTFSLAGLPDMPNPRSTGDLFDCVLPRITLPEDLDDAETQLLGFIGVSAQLAWESNNRWDDHPPDNMPEGHTFRDTTPQALLDWYLDHTPGAWVRYDPDGLVLHLNEEESDWWGRLKEGFQRILQML